MTPAVPSSPARRRSRAASGWRWVVCTVSLGAASVSAQTAPASFGGFAAGDVTAEAFAASVVQPGIGGGVAPPSDIELASPASRQLARARATLHALVPRVERCATPSALRPASAAAGAEFSTSLSVLRADPVNRGVLSVVHAGGDVVAFQRQLGDDRRVIVFNRADAERFLPLPETGDVPGPLTPVFASWGERSEIPALVAVVDETRGEIVYGLRIPARTAVVFRPVEPEDVRPTGLDE